MFKSKVITIYLISHLSGYCCFKLHIVINDKGELSSVDREPLKNEAFLKDIFGKLFGDKGYISDKLHKLLFVKEIEFITGILK